MLKKLAHGSGVLPPNQHWIKITIPNGITYEPFSVAHMPSWADPSATEAEAYGAAWQASKRTLLLLVPSVVARIEYNFVLNPEHPEYPKVTYGLPQPCWWDSRLFAPPATP
jgi:RES domain-containing protein